MKATKSNQEKLHDILRSLDFTIRYERGNFTGGYCMVKSEQIIIINKFFPLESKINTLVDILKVLEIDKNKLEEHQVRLLDKVKKEL